MLPNKIQFNQSINVVDVSLGLARQPLRGFSRGFGFSSQYGKFR